MVHADNCMVKYTEEHDVTMFNIEHLELDMNKPFNSTYKTIYIKARSYGETRSNRIAKHLDLSKKYFGYESSKILVDVLRTSRYTLLS